MSISRHRNLLRVSCAASTGVCPWLRVGAPLLPSFSLVIYQPAEWLLRMALMLSLAGTNCELKEYAILSDTYT